MFAIYGLDPQVDLPTHKNFRQRVHPKRSQQGRRKIPKRGWSSNNVCAALDEFRIIAAGGTVKHVSSAWHTILTITTESIMRIGTFYCDGHNEDRKRAEEALRESEYQHRQIIDTVPGFLWAGDPAGEPTQINQHMVDYSGMRFEDFKHGGWEAFVHPDDFPETAKAFYHAIAQTGDFVPGCDASAPGGRRVSLAPFSC